MVLFDTTVQRYCPSWQRLVYAQKSLRSTRDYYDDALLVVVAVVGTVAHVELLPVVRNAVAFQDLLNSLVTNQMVIRVIVSRKRTIAFPAMIFVML